MCRQPTSIISYYFPSLFMWSHRVLRHTVFICASRSLSVQASACRSSVPPHQSLDDKGSGGTLVFIDVENINTVRYTACHTSPVHTSSMQLFAFAVKLNNLSLLELLICLFLAPRVKLVCVSSTSSRCPAAVNTGAYTSVSIQPRIKVGLAHLRHLCFVSSMVYINLSFYYLLCTAVRSSMSGERHFNKIFHNIWKSWYSQVNKGAAVCTEFTTLPTSSLFLIQYYRTAPLSGCCNSVVSWTSGARKLSQCPVFPSQLSRINWNLSPVMKSIVHLAQSSLNHSLVTELFRYEFKPGSLYVSLCVCTMY